VQKLSPSHIRMINSVTELFGSCIADYIPLTEDSLASLDEFSMDYMTFAHKMYRGVHNEYMGTVGKSSLPFVQVDLVNDSILDTSRVICSDRLLSKFVDFWFQCQEVKDVEWKMEAYSPFLKSGVQANISFSFCGV